MSNIFWDIYGRVYDAALLELIPYQNMLRLAGETLEPRRGGIYFDAGCGTGNLMSRLVDFNDEINLVGADFSSAMLKRAMKKVVGRGGSVSFQKLDLNKKIPIESNTFDGATCINVLYILDRPENLIIELHRILKKHGRLIIVTPQNEPKLAPVIKEHIEILKDKYPEKWFIFLAGQIGRIFIPAIISILLNLFIIRNRKYNFFKEVELKTLIENNGFLLKSSKIIYGQQGLYLLAEKE